MRKLTRKRWRIMFDHKNKGIIATCPQGHIGEVMPKDQALGQWFCHHPDCNRFYSGQAWNVHRWAYVERPKRVPKEKPDYGSYKSL